MPWAKRLHCEDCNHVWDVLLMQKDEALPDCPVCASKAGETLAAPRINTGAQPSTQLAIPENKTRAIDQAMRWVSDDNGGVNIRTDAKPGESVAVPVPQDPRTAGLSGFVGHTGNVGTLNLGTLPQIAGRVAPEDKAKNLGILGAMGKKSAPLKPVAAASMRQSK